MAIADAWTADETDRLKDLVIKHGSKAWTTIADDLRTRNSKQCRRRWKNFIAFPERKDTQWTDEEDAVLLEEYAKFGNHWTDIATKLTGRTDNAVKNRWGLLQKRNSLWLAPVVQHTLQVCASCPHVVPMRATDDSLHTCNDARAFTTPLHAGARPATANAKAREATQRD